MFIKYSVIKYIRNKFHSKFLSSKYDTRISMVRNTISSNGVYAELGVFDGSFSREIINILDPKALVLIDYFEGDVESGDQDGNNSRVINLDLVYNDLLKRYRDNNRIKILKGDTVESLSQFPNDYFDMVYVDADHRYEGCLRDLEISYQKVKNNGWILGHDYEINLKKAKTKFKFGVKKAVDEFCLKYDQYIKIKALDGCVGYGIQCKK